MSNLATAIQKAGLFDLLWIGAFFFAFVFIDGANAQAASGNFGDDNVGLDAMYNPAYDPIGIRVGGFLLNPSLTGSSKYTDNVYAQKNATSSDFITALRPAVNLKSNFSRHKIDLRTYYEQGKYRDNESENYDDFGATLDSRIDVTGNTNIPLTFGYSKLHEDREIPNSLNNIKPLIYKMTEATTGIISQGQRLVYKVISSFKKLSYDDAQSISGTIDESSRDRDVYGLYLSAGITPEAILAPYLYSNIQKLKYRLANSTFNRDSNEFEAGAGTIINISDITHISFNLGQRHRNFEDSALSDINALTFGSNISWAPLENLSFLFEGDRAIQEATFSGTSASINTSLRLSINYQFRDNIFLQPSCSFLNRDYQGSNAGRLETTNAGLNVLYKMNPNIWVNASYQFTNQDAIKQAPGLQSFQRNVYGVSLKLQF